MIYDKDGNILTEYIETVHGDDIESTVIEHKNGGREIYGESTCTDIFEAWSNLYDGYGNLTDYIKYDRSGEETRHDSFRYEYTEGTTIQFEFFKNYLQPEIYD